MSAASTVRLSIYLTGGRVSVHPGVPRLTAEQILTAFHRGDVFALHSDSGGIYAFNPVHVIEVEVRPDVVRERRHT